MPKLPRHCHERTAGAAAPRPPLHNLREGAEGGRAAGIEGWDHLRRMRTICVLAPNGGNATCLLHDSSPTLTRRGSFRCYRVTACLLTRRKFGQLLSEPAGFLFACFAAMSGAARAVSGAFRAVGTADALDAFFPGFVDVPQHRSKDHSDNCQDKKIHGIHRDHLPLRAYSAARL